MRGLPKSVRLRSPDGVEMSLPCVPVDWGRQGWQCSPWREWDRGPGTYLFEARSEDGRRVSTPIELDGSEWEVTVELLTESGMLHSTNVVLHRPWSGVELVRGPNRFELRNHTTEPLELRGYGVVPGRAIHIGERGALTHAPPGWLMCAMGRHDFRVEAGQPREVSVQLRFAGPGVYEVRVSGPRLHPRLGLAIDQEARLRVTVGTEEAATRGLFTERVWRPIVRHRFEVRNRPETRHRLVGGPYRPGR